MTASIIETTTLTILTFLAQERVKCMPIAKLLSVYYELLWVTLIVVCQVVCNNLSYRV